eukprot:2169855-Rhodomonas_salina.1
MARTGWEKRQLVLIPSVEASAALFVPGVDYHVKLHARAGGVEGESQSLLRVPLPPTGGVCTVSRATAAALVEDLEVTCQVTRPYAPTRCTVPRPGTDVERGGARSGAQRACPCSTDSDSWRVMSGTRAPRSGRAKGT